MSAWRGRALGVALALAACPVAAQVDLTPYLKQDVYREIKISPTGEYYAATVPLEDRTILVEVRRSDKQPTARISGVRVRTSPTSTGSTTNACSSVPPSA